MYVVVIYGLIINVLLQWNHFLFNVIYVVMIEHVLCWWLNELLYYVYFNCSDIKVSLVRGFLKGGNGVFQTVFGSIF